MKTKALTILAALSLVGCSNNELVNDINDELTEKPIGFSVFADKATKANTNNKTNLDFFYPTFNVYGSKYTSEWKPVFANVTNEFFASDAKGTVVYDADGEKPSKEWTFAADSWYYEGVRYWDKFATKYQFGAYAPVAASSEVAFATSTGDDGVITIGSSGSKVTVESTNLMATPKTELAYKGFTKDYMTALAHATSSPVSLTFAHELAKFDIKLALNTSVVTNQDVVVNEITIHNMNGTSYYDSSKETADGFLTGWATPVTELNYTVKGVGSATTGYKLNGTTAGTDNFDGYYVLECLMIPQTIDKNTTADAKLTEFDEACLYIKYTIGTEEFVGYYALANMFITGTGNSYNFSGGNEYILTITVGPAPIYFTASVSAWTENAASYDVQ